MSTDPRTPGGRVHQRDAALRRTAAWTAALAVAGAAGTGIVALTAAQASSAAAATSTTDQGQGADQAPDQGTDQGTDQGPAVNAPGPPPVVQGQGQGAPAVGSSGS